MTAQSLQPASIDCTLGDHFLVVEDRNMHVIDLSSEIQYREYIGSEITIPPLLSTRHNAGVRQNSK